MLRPSDCSHRIEAMRLGSGTSSIGPLTLPPHAQHLLLTAAAIWARNVATYPSRQVSYKLVSKLTRETVRLACNVYLLVSDWSALRPGCSLVGGCEDQRIGSTLFKIKGSVVVPSTQRPPQGRISCPWVPRRNDERVPLHISTVFLVLRSKTVRTQGLATSHPLRVALRA